MLYNFQSDHDRFLRQRPFPATRTSTKLCFNEAMTHRNFAVGQTVNRKENVTVQVWGRPPVCRFTESLTPCSCWRRNAGPEARPTGRPEVCPTLGPEQLPGFIRRHGDAGEGSHGLDGVGLEDLLFAFQLHFVWKERAKSVMLFCIYPVFILFHPALVRASSRILWAMVAFLFFVYSFLFFLVSCHRGVFLGPVFSISPSLRIADSRFPTLVTFWAGFRASLILSRRRSSRSPRLA